MDVNSPYAPERDYQRQCFQLESKHKSRQVDQANRINTINGMFPVCRQPVEFFGAMMYFVKTPEKIYLVLEAVSPVNKQVTQKQHFNRL